MSPPLAALVLALAACNAGGLLLPEPRADLAPPVDAGPDSADAAPVIPDPLLDGVCTRIPITSGILDPDCVYAISINDTCFTSTLTLFDPERPADRVGGVPCDHAWPTIRPTDGRLVYTQVPSRDRARIFIPGSAPVDVVAPGCTRVERVFAFRDGALGLYCVGLEDFIAVVPTGETIPLHAQPIAPGPARSLLVWNADTREGAIVDPSGTKTRVTGISGSYPWIWLARSTETGFLAVVSGVEETALYEIALDGRATRRGAYQLGIPAVTTTNPCALDSDGRVLCAPLYRLTLTAPPVYIGDLSSGLKQGEPFTGM